MLNRTLKTIYQHSYRLAPFIDKHSIFLVNFLKMSDEPVVKKIRYDGRVKKRNWEERRSDRNAENRPNATDEDKSDVVRVKRRKYAMLLGYSGVDYYGMQRNPNMQTIEEELLKSLLKTDMITSEAFTQVQTIQFQRAARTDKGVSAARQVVSLKLPDQVDISVINNELPDKIRIFAVKRVTKGFNSKSNCDARTYTYMLPTLAFAKHGDVVDPDTYRISEDVLDKVNETLKLFVGTKNFHNFTSKKKPRDPSAMRFIISFDCDKPFVSKNVEFVVLKVKGQSFMLHQIRKMIGLVIAIVRGHTTADTIKRSWSSEKLDIPMAPGLGLVLDQVHYDRYNVRYGSDGVHDTLEWNEAEPLIAKFKEDNIYPTIVETELKEKSMVGWLETLPCHSFDVRNEADGDEENGNIKDSDDEDGFVVNDVKDSL